MTGDEGHLQLGAEGLARELIVMDAQSVFYVESVLLHGSGQRDEDERGGIWSPGWM